MKKLVLLIFSLVMMLFQAEAVSYVSFRRDCDVLLSKKNADWEGDYSKLPVNWEVPVIIDNSDLKITIGSSQFEFMEVPKEWNVSQKWRCVRYECIDLVSLGKCYIYLIEYDKTKNSRLMVRWYDIDDKYSEIYNIRK